jgi:hypothetical protein
MAGPGAGAIAASLRACDAWGGRPDVAGPTLPPAPGAVGATAGGGPAARTGPGRPGAHTKV